MRTLPHARFAAFLIAIVASAPSRVWSADEAERGEDPEAEAPTQPAGAEEGSLEETSAPASDEAPLENPAASDTEAEPEVRQEERPELRSRLPQAARASAEASALALATPASPPPAPHIPQETPAEFNRRIQQARQLAAKQRKTRTVDAPPPGLSREELEIRAAERNITIYDKQIASGEGTQAIEAYRKYALQTLADVRRRHLAKTWADTLQHADAPRILREHAQRMAELKRIRLLADVKSFSGIVRQTEELMAKETRRFEASMQALRGGVAPTANGSKADLAQAAASR